MNKIKDFFIGLLYENYEPSLTRCIIASAFLLFTIVTLYLAINDINWSGYSSFAYVAGGGAICGKVADRAVAVISGSPAGQMPSVKNGGK